MFESNHVKYLAPIPNSAKFLLIHLLAKTLDKKSRTNPKEKKFEMLKINQHTPPDDLAGDSIMSTFSE